MKKFMEYLKEDTKDNKELAKRKEKVDQVKEEVKITPDQELSQLLENQPETKYIINKKGFVDFIKTKYQWYSEDDIIKITKNMNEEKLNEKLEKSITDYDREQVMIKTGYVFGLTEQNMIDYGFLIPKEKPIKNIWK